MLFVDYRRFDTIILYRQPENCVRPDRRGLPVGLHQVIYCDNTAALNAADTDTPLKFGQKNEL